MCGEVQGRPTCPCVHSFVLHELSLRAGGNGKQTRNICTKEPLTSLRGTWTLSWGWEELGVVPDTCTEERTRYEGTSPSSVILTLIFFSSPLCLPESNPPFSVLSDGKISWIYVNMLRKSNVEKDDNILGCCDEACGDCLGSFSVCVNTNRMVNAIILYRRVWYFVERRNVSFYDVSLLQSPPSHELHGVYFSGDLFKANAVVCFKKKKKNELIASNEASCPAEGALVPCPKPSASLMVTITSFHSLLPSVLMETSVQDGSVELTDIRGWTGTGSRVVSAFWIVFDPTFASELCPNSTLHTSLKSC